MPPLQSSPAVPAHHLVPRHAAAIFAFLGLKSSPGKDARDSARATTLSVQSAQTPRV